MISAKQKFAIDFAISLNPSNVIISRVEYEEVDGARVKKTEVIDEQQWLVYPKSPSAKLKREDGGNADESTWGALAPSTANVRWGANVTDTFVLPDIGTLEVVSGRPIMIATDLNGYQLDLKLVK